MKGFVQKFHALVAATVSAVSLCGADAQWETGAGFRWKPLQIPASGKTGFVQLDASATGIRFTNTLSEWSIAANRVLANGAGVAAGDFDNDGLTDLFFCNLEGPSALYRNLGGFKFEDVFAKSGIGRTNLVRGAAFADINHDGWLDLVLTTTADGVLCFANDKTGKFADVTTESGLKGESGAFTLAFADVDRNGTLDLYVTNYRPDDVRDKGKANFRMVNGRPILSPREPNRFLMRNGQLTEAGQPDQLFLNDGKGKFSRVSWTGGAFLDAEGKPVTEPPHDWGLSATFRDVNGDGAPDLYVCNDYWTPDRFWINDGAGKFRLIDPVGFRKMSDSAMGVDFADLDRDGDFDFFVVDMLSRDARLRRRQGFAQKVMLPTVMARDLQPQVMRNTLYMNAGAGNFTEVAAYAGVIASDWSWSPIFMDVDLDGFEDLLISAGHFKDTQDLDAAETIRARQHSWEHITDEAARQRAFTAELVEHYRLYPKLEMPIVAFRNGGGWKFTEQTSAWGLASLAVHHGMATADLDGDGDLDIAVNNLNSIVGIYRNESAAPRVMARIRVDEGGRNGVGVQLTLRGGPVSAQWTELVAGGRYLSGCEVAAVFAAGAGEMQLEARWPDGRVATIAGVRANRVYEFDGTGLATRSEPEKKTVAPLFEDLSRIVPHVHRPNNFDDFERQPLLPFMLSEMGPGVSWVDFEGDGIDELLVGASAGSAPGVYKLGANGFTNMLPQLGSLNQDSAAAITTPDGRGGLQILTGLSGYETAGPDLVQTVSAEGFRAAAAGLGLSNVAALAFTQLTPQGEMALFVGGGVLPRSYPLGAPSRLLIRSGDAWRVDAANSALFSNLGVVNGAVWSDLSGDGYPDLIVACEWGSLRVFNSRVGRLIDVTETLGLAEHKGLWKGVATGDFNNDGLMDIVASNWGLNTPYQASASEPLVFYHGPLHHPKLHDIIETEYDGGKLAARHQLARLAGAMPFLLEHFQSHRAYSESSIDAMLGERKRQAREVRATTLASTLFMNRGAKFEAIPLPMEAQLAPAFSVVVADFNGDWHEDIFLAQNFSPIAWIHGPADAGSGLLLEGQGEGKFKALSIAQSGIQIPGDQRGAAAGDFDHDGRADLAVGVNNGSARLFRNVRGRPSLRVSLEGSAKNPQGIGAAVRVFFTERSAGPMREVQAGSGWLSQKSATELLAIPNPPIAIWVRWPGGRVTYTELPEGEREIRVSEAGALLR